MCSCIAVFLLAYQHLVQQALLFEEYLFLLFCCGRMIFFISQCALARLMQAGAQTLTNRDTAVPLATRNR